MFKKKGTWLTPDNYCFYNNYIQSDNNKWNINTSQYTISRNKYTITDSRLHIIIEPARQLVI